MAQDIYADIAGRTDGDIYIGVVGPVRTGKSTFIKRFMETLVIPNIQGEYKRERAMDELPQSAAGKTIMTTEPKFIPEDAVEITPEEGARLRVRLIDCVGYIVPSSLGYIENENPRMVATPWFEEEVPFNMAAEVGTRKVISEHSTIGLVVTTDGSISDIPRSEYAECEQRVIRELQELGKPFVVLLNCTDPESEDALALCEQMRQAYGAAVIPVSCLELTETDIRSIITQILYAFPVKEIRVEMPGWITELAPDHWLRESVFGAIRTAASELVTVRDARGLCERISCPQITDAKVRDIDLGCGSVTVGVRLEPGLFYQILGETTGLDIGSESDLLPVLLEVLQSDRLNRFLGFFGAISLELYLSHMAFKSAVKALFPEFVHWSTLHCVLVYGGVLIAAVWFSVLFHQAQPKLESYLFHHIPKKKGAFLL